MISWYSCRLKRRGPIVLGMCIVFDLEHVFGSVDYSV